MSKAANNSNSRPTGPTKESDKVPLATDKIQNDDSAAAASDVVGESKSLGKKLVLGVTPGYDHYVSEP